MLVRRIMRTAVPSAASATSLPATTRRRHLYLSPPFIVEDYEPASQASHRSGKLAMKEAAALKCLEDCRLCPRDCGVDRTRDLRGACNTGRHAVVSSAFPHYGEESVLQGWNGSGTIFFSLCNLRCVFCQNWDISQRKEGWLCDADKIADLMLRLQEETRCHNVNFVTPEHVVPQVVEAVSRAVERGFNLPVVYNTSSYDSVESVDLLEGVVDIYLPDFKFWKADTAQRYCKARDYPEVAKAAIKKMHGQVGDLLLDPNGLAKKGVILRHLVMPGLVNESRAIMRWAAEELSRDVYVNVMEQYRPTFTVGVGENRARTGFTKYDEIDRPVTETEADEVKRYAREVGLWRFEDNVYFEAPPGKN